MLWNTWEVSSPRGDKEEREEGKMMLKYPTTKKTREILCGCGDIQPIIRGHIKHHW